MIELEYTYTEEPDGWLVGCLNMYPDCLTQGKDLAELEFMLADVYTLMKLEEATRAEIEQEEKDKKARQRNGRIMVEVPA